MKYIKVPGEKSDHRVLMYAISTCMWCKRAKQFLNDHNVEYTYVDVDLCTPEDRETIRHEILARGGRLVYPAILVDDRVVINGFQTDKIREAIGIE
jgi:glutaredoxin-like protein NrdH